MIDGGAPAASGQSRARWTRGARWLALVAVSVAAFVYLRGHAEELAGELAPRWGLLVALALAEAVLLVVRGLLTRLLCVRFGVRLGVVEATRLSAWTSFANYVTPLVGGTGLRAVYLKQRHQLPFASFLSVQLATYSLHFQIAAVVGLGALVALPGPTSPLRAGLGIGLGVVLAACLLLHHWPLAPPRGQGRLGRYLAHVIAGWSEIRSGEVRPLAAVLVVNAATQAVAVATSFAALGVAMSWTQALFVSSIYSFSILIALTPAALGVSEGAVAIAATAAGLAGPSALACAAVRRLVSIGVTLIAAATSALGGSSGPGGEARAQRGAGAE